MQLRDAADKAAMELRAAAARATNAATKAQVVAESQILQAEEVCPLNIRARHCLCCVVAAHLGPTNAPVCCDAAHGLLDRCSAANLWYVSLRQ